MLAMQTQSTSEIASQMAAQASQTNTISKWTKDKLSMLNQDNKSTNKCHQDSQSIKGLMLTMFIQDQSEEKCLIKGLNTNYLHKFTLQPYFLY